MATLNNLFAHRGDFKPSAPTSDSDRCKYPNCGGITAFSAWGYHSGTDSGYYCDDCNDFHSCFECPACGEFVGAAGMYVGEIEVVADQTN